jgi:hypothetical protein
MTLKYISQRFLQEKYYIKVKNQWFRKKVSVETDFGVFYQFDSHGYLTFCACHEKKFLIISVLIISVIGWFVLDGGPVFSQEGRFIDSRLPKIQRGFRDGFRVLLCGKIGWSKFGYIGC